MPERNQAALDFMLTRRSRPAKTLTGPGPDRDTLTTILTAAARTPITARWCRGVLLCWKNPP